MQPVKTDFFNFDPTISHRLQAALLECLAVAVAVEQGETAMERAWCEQRDEVSHGKLPCGAVNVKIAHKPLRASVWAMTDR